VKFIVDFIKPHFSWFELLTGMVAMGVTFDNGWPITSWQWWTIVVSLGIAWTIAGKIFKRVTK